MDSRTPVRPRFSSPLAGETGMVFLRAIIKVLVTTSDGSTSFIVPRAIPAPILHKMLGAPKPIGTKNTSLPTRIGKPRDRSSNFRRSAYGSPVSSSSPRADKARASKATDDITPRTAIAASLGSWVIISTVLAVL